VSRPSRSSRAGWRGRHRHIDSPETKVFHKLERDLDSILNLKPTESQKRKKTKKRKPLGPAPHRPAWIEPGTYDALCRLRATL
jgi:hypothetical protein